LWITKKVSWECEYVGFMLKKKFFILRFFYLLLPY
jgi:hypothetical protein